MSRRVLVTGIGVVSPIGTGKVAFLNALKEGRSGVRFIEELAQYGFGCQVGGVPEPETSGYNNYLEKYELNTASRVIQYAVLAGLEAWEDSGLSIPDIGKGGVDNDTGIIIGSGIGTIDIFGERVFPLTNEQQIKKLRSRIVEQSMLSGPAATLSSILGAGNQVSFNSSACSTGTEAIFLGTERIREGKAERMLVGASEAYSPYCWSPFDALRVTVRKYNDIPEKACRPMSASAAGFVPAAGSAVLLLESESSAMKRGANVYAEIAGGFVNSGGQRNGGTMTAPNPEGVTSCIRQAVKNAGIKVDDIDLISGHLSSTMADPMEIKNWSNALGRKGKEFPYVVSTKSLMGHAIGAAGAIETVAAVLSIQERFIHPTLNCEDLHPEIAELVDASKIPFKLIPDVDINCIAKASFGFGDVNACLILKKT